MFPNAGISSIDSNPDALVVGDGPITSKVVTVKSGNTLTRGTLLGTRRLGAVTAVAKVGNTGAGTCTPDVTTPLLAGAQVGKYRAVCIGTATNSGTFQVYDPNGNVLGDVVVGATFQNQIKFVIVDGTPDFAVGDEFDLTVAVGDLKVVSAVATAVDGSAEPDLILAEDVDASAGDVDGVAYNSGIFNSTVMTIDGSLTIAGITEVLREKGIYLKAGQPAE